MQLTKGNVTFDLSHPSEIKRFKAMGFVEDRGDPAPVEKPDTDPETETKGGDPVPPAPVAPPVAPPPAPKIAQPRNNKKGG